MGVRGPKEKLTQAKMEQAILRTKSLNPTVLAKFLGVHRSTPERWMKKPENEEFMDRMRVRIEKRQDYGTGKISYEAFKKIDSIQNWQTLMEKKEVRPAYAHRISRGVWHTCNYLGVHPENLTYEMVSDMILDMKQKARSGQPVPKGLAWTNVRVAIRSWFTVGLGLSGAKLSSMGVDASATDNSGKFAHEQVSPEERKRFETTLKEVLAISYMDSRFDDIRPYMYEETLAYCRFLFYTGTRKQAGIEIKLNDPMHVLDKDIWTIHVLDKGKKGGIDWQKILYGKSLEYLKKYIMHRFNIPEEYLVSEMRTRDQYLFPSLHKFDFPAVIKKALIKAGNPYMISHKGRATFPVHIWRHTFAQSTLKATNWNYELTASLGGWKNTNILKNHYGAMSTDARLEGLQVAMGLKVEKEKVVLEW